MTPTKESEFHAPIVSNDVINGRKAYRTSDIVEPHPTLPSLWRIYGRKDDQIMLSTGEKVCDVFILCRC